MKPRPSAAAVVAAEIKQAEQETRLASVKADRELLALARDQEEERNRLAAASNHLIFDFYSQVSGSSVDTCIQTLSHWHRREPIARELRLVFNSPGGSVFDGFALHDYLRELRDAGRRIVTVALGMAASMAGILLQAGDERVIGRTSYLLIHEISAGALGSVAEIEDKAKFLKELQAKGYAILAERSTLSPRQIRNRAERRDWWLDAEHALKLGFVDVIR